MTSLSIRSRVIIHLYQGKTKIAKNICNYNSPTTPTFNISFLQSLSETFPIKLLMICRFDGFLLIDWHLIKLAPDEFRVVIFILNRLILCTRQIRPPRTFCQIYKCFHLIWLHIKRNWWIYIPVLDI